MKHIAVLLSIFFLFMLAFNLQAQDWTDAQKEVWMCEFHHWSCFEKRDLDGMLATLDENYMGWAYTNDIPLNKTETAKILKEYLESLKGKTTKVKLTPLEIWVEGNVAYVHYTFFYTDIAENGESEETFGRWTDIFHKKGGKWLCVGDHGGNMPQNSPAL